MAAKKWCFVWSIMESGVKRHKMVVCYSVIWKNEAEVMAKKWNEEFLLRAKRWERQLAAKGDRGLQLAYTTSESLEKVSKNNQCIRRF